VSWGAAFRCALLCLLTATHAAAEQLQSFGNWDIHYVVVPSTFLRPEIALQYSVVRAKNRSLVNISVLDKAGKATRGKIRGTTVNLLGQLQALEFREVAEASAIYYLAEIEHDNEEVLRFRITATIDGRELLVEFQQKLYWEDADAARAR